MNTSDALPCATVALFIAIDATLTELGINTICQMARLRDGTYAVFVELPAFDDAPSVRAIMTVAASLGAYYSTRPNTTDTLVYRLTFNPEQDASPSEI